MNLTALKRAGICFFAATSLAAPSAFALIDLDHAAVILNTQFGISYDSNILGRNGGAGDTLFTFAPSLEYRRGEGRGTIDFNAHGTFVAYASESERNREDYGVSGVITVPVSTDSPLSGGLHASYGRNTNVSESVGDLVTTKALNIGANGGYAFSERLSGTASFNYGTNENENYGDNKSWSGSAGLSFSQLIFRRLPLSLSYTYSSQESTDDPTSARKLDTKSHSFNVGTNGQISSKVQGSISVGVRSTDDNGTGSGSFGGNSGFVASTGLNWAYDELTTVRLSVSKSLAVTTDNQSTDSTMIGIGYSRKLSEQLSANAGANYSLQNYTAQDRKDTMIGLSGGLSYQIRRNWSAGVNYSYTQNFAGVAFNDFDRHVIGATVTGRF